MIALASFFLVILVTLIMVRAAILALAATGLPYEIARFRARSALSGVAFTTSEAETVVGHPVRRRIVLTLMLVGNAGLVTIAASLILTFAGGASTSQAMIRLGIIVALVGALPAIVRNQRLEAWITRQIAKGLGHWTDLEVRDMVHLMQLTNAYAITRRPAPSRRGGTRSRCAASRRRLCRCPRGSTVVHTYDNLILYGRSAVLSDLDERRDDITGDHRHQNTVSKQQQILAESSDT